MGKPNGWEYCPRMCLEPILGKFIAFKTPYQPKGYTPTENSFTVSSVFQLAEERGMKMGLWIDLTDTNRYYDPSEVEKNCVYVKLQCSGKDVSKLDSLSEEFNSVCNQFFEDCPGLLVGVHCTHGFNRTGFFIVSYMIKMFGWNPVAAVNEFARVRPPGIYRKNKIDELSRTYKVRLRVPEAPHWKKNEGQRSYQNNMNSHSRREDGYDRTNYNWRTGKSTGQAETYNFNPNHRQRRTNLEEPLSWRK